MSTFQVRDEIAEGRKPTKLIPQIVGKGEDSITIRRFKKLRAMFLAATPFRITGSIPPREPSAVLLPPFDSTWFEWTERHYGVGAHVGWSSVGTLVTAVVISGRSRSSIYDRPDSIHLDPAGSFLRRADFAAKLWPGKPEHERRAYERVYDILAYLNEPGPLIEEVGEAQYRVNPPESRGEITTVLVEIAGSKPSGRGHPRHDPVRPLHEVRGHGRRYKSGKVSWVQPHTRGDATIGTHIATYILGESDNHGTHQAGR
jgi:hypothetical protein